MKIKQVVAMLSVSLTLAAGGARAADKVTFQLDWLPGGDKAPVYVGIKQGFFSAENLDVKVAAGRGSTDAITKLATGSSDIGTSDIGALLAARATDKVPVTAVYSVFTEAPHAFMVLHGGDVHSVKDVAGKKVATSPFTSSNLFLPLVLKDNGLAPDAITLTKADPGALGPMLVTGQADVVISWVTDTQRYRDQAHSAGKDIDVIPWSGAGLDLYSTALIASDRFLKERPDVARRFVKAFAKSVAFCHDHPDVAGQDIHAMVPEVDAKVAAATLRDTLKLIYNDVSQRDGLGVFKQARLASTWKWVAEAQHLAPASLDVETTVDRSFLPEN